MRLLAKDTGSAKCGAAPRAVSADDTSAAAILEVVRATSVSLKRSLSENELLYIYQDYKEGTNPGQ